MNQINKFGGFMEISKIYTAKIKRLNEITKIRQTLPIILYLKQSS